MSVTTGSLIGLAVSASMAPLGSFARAAADHSTSQVGRIGWRLVAIVANVAEIAGALVSSNLVDTRDIGELDNGRILQVADVALASHGLIELAQNMISLYHTDRLPPQNQEQPQAHDNPAYDPDEDQDQDQDQTQTSAL